MSTYTTLSDPQNSRIGASLSRVIYLQRVKHRGTGPADFTPCFPDSDDVRYGFQGLPESGDKAADPEVRVLC